MIIATAEEVNKLDERITKLERRTSTFWIDEYGVVHNKYCEHCGSELKPKFRRYESLLRKE